VSEYYTNGPGSDKWQRAVAAAEEEARLMARSGTSRSEPDGAPAALAGAGAGVAGGSATSRQAAAPGTGDAGFVRFSGSLSYNLLGVRPSRTEFFHVDEGACASPVEHTASINTCNRMTCREGVNARYP
jgi:hypothetical protein